MVQAEEIAVYVEGDSSHNSPQEPLAAPQGEDMALSTSAPKSEAGDEYESRESKGRPWRLELSRWLLTLNPGRTQDEYSKAVRYFFEAPGAPQSLDSISADLLLAYRGALALRAERVGAGRGKRGAAPSTSARLDGLGDRQRAARLPGDQARDIPPRTGAGQVGRLSPATVNLRLTALRQFLRFATIRDPLPDLTVERIQAALRRLPFERRRPYQILAEEEWPVFLAVARAPLAEGATVEAVDVHEVPSPAAPPPNEFATAPHSPWGVTHAQRVHPTPSDPAPVGEGRGVTDDPAAQPIQSPTRAQDGRTGARTARRDYALVALALTTGLRAIELSLLDVSDISRERRNGQVEWWLVLPDEKTKGQRGGRTLPLAPEVASALLDYIQSTGRSFAVASDRATPLFLALPNGPHPNTGHDASEASAHVDELRRVQPEQIRPVINRIETQWLAQRDEGASEGAMDGRRISPHALRHSAAIALLKGSEATGRPPASVEHVRGWLGHFDIRTTQRYLDHLSSRDERRRFIITPGAPQASVSATSQPPDKLDAQPEEP